MIRRMSESDRLVVTVHPAARLAARLPTLTAFALADRPAPLGRHPAWLGVLAAGLGHEVYAAEATVAGTTCGYLPLALVSSSLFGRFLVSLPYLNANGVVAHSPDVATALIDRAVGLADELNVKHLELRHETAVEHPALNGSLTTKVHMRRWLPGSAAELWAGLDPKVRNQVRKGEKSAFTVEWGGSELLGAFYAVLAENMRDLGTPVYGRQLFEAILAAFAGDAELCVVAAGAKPVACALLLHGRGTTEVPTASSLRAYNATCVNMLMYRHLLDRAISRGQTEFDFGRSTADGPTFKFKKQWGATPTPATWQYCVRAGDAGQMRPDNPKYERLIRVWQRLPGERDQSDRAGCRAGDSLTWPRY